MGNPKMTLVMKSGARQRFETDESMTFGLGLNPLYEKEILLPVPHHHGEEYVRDYNRGWRARPGAEEFDSGTGSVGYDDGYLDRAASREKWHLAWCDMHGECGRA